MAKSLRRPITLGVQRAKQAQVQREGFVPCFIDPEQIRPRPVDTQPIRESDIERMLQSILDVGRLLDPIRLDAQNRPLAGACRAAACLRIKQRLPEDFRRIFPSGVPALRSEHIDWDVNPHEADQWTFVLQAQREPLKGARLRAKIRELAERMRADPQADFAPGAGRLPEGRYSGVTRLAHFFAVTPQTIRLALVENDPSKEGARGGDAWHGSLSALAKNLGKMQRMLGKGHRRREEINAELVHIDAAMRRIAEYLDEDSIPADGPVPGE